MSAELPRTFKLVTVWLLLGLGLFLGVQWWLHAQQQARFTAGSEVIEIRRGPDGHYHWPGSIVGSGTVSNQDWSRGYSCIAEKRAIETIESGAPKTEFMRYGDSIRIEMKGADGLSVFGAIDQDVAAPAG